MFAVCHLAFLLPAHMVPEEDHEPRVQLLPTGRRHKPASIHPWDDTTRHILGSDGPAARLWGVLRFAILAKVMLAFVIIPIYNAASEQAFSMVKKIETDFQSELAQDTMCALLSTKMNSDIRPSLIYVEQDAACP